MTAVTQADPPPSGFLAVLEEHGLITTGQAPGILGLSAELERVVAGLHAELSALERDAHGATLHFPPVLSRATLERSGYLEGFPHLLGSIHGFLGDERDRAALSGDAEQGKDWGARQSLADVVLAPAVCYHVYPLLEGRLPPRGRSVNAFSYCYRHEQTAEAGRFRAFRVEEFVYAGDAHTSRRWRDEWLQRGEAYLAGLGLSVRRARATDPFFGVAGRLLAADQRQRALKYELQVPVHSTELLTAVASFNVHDDHFARRFGIRRADGEIATTACAGFGLERVTFALLAAHGIDLDAWPEALRARLCR